ncbi:NADH-quinone oxidoreductase subunit K [Nesterenkonia populi]|uniref:NADH-quinone oxidoreductase subunit K n=1 Tax=Nesterenkonia populi TaxID=1591087 RepID=UPI0011BF3B33|nr:NADH-quinone oxidoreductase subunit K [Nesterenkonia populi]
MSAAVLYLLLGTAVCAAGTVRLLLVRDLVARLIAMNVVGIGSLLILLAIASRAPEEAEPVLSALVITGLVITVAFTGFGAVLIRRIEEGGERG